MSSFDLSSTAAALPSLSSVEPQCVSFGGGRKVSLEDVSNIAIFNHQVVLDPSTLAKVEDDSKKCPSVPGDVTVFPVTSGPAAELSVCRAALLVKITTILQARFGIRSIVVELLAEMLNKDIVPVFSNEESAGTDLILVITAKGGNCFTPDGVHDSANAFASFGLKPIALTASEMNTLAYSQFFVTGRAALYVSGVLNIASVIDVVASLSCEAAGASLESFDAVNFDACRQHRGQMASSANLRQMLEGSKRCSSERSLSYPAMQQTPQVNGPVVESLLICKKYVMGLRYKIFEHFSNLFNLYIVRNTDLLNLNSPAQRKVRYRLLSKPSIPHNQILQWKMLRRL